MISESISWKKPLLRAASWLEQISVSDRNAEEALVKAEKEVFLEFYSIRKLLDTFKVTDKTRKIFVSLIWYPCIKPVDYLNAHKIDEHYDLHSRSHEERDLAFVCNQFVHSYIFLISTDESGGIAGFFVSSDRTRQKKLYFVPIAALVSVFRAVGNDHPVRHEMTRNKNTGQWEGAVE